MEPDILGVPYEQRIIDLGQDDEGPVVATLVRRRAPARTSRAVLWVHGWSDYFFQTHVADYFVSQGFDFYALDLRKYGRSLHPHQTPTFCRSLAEYVPELDEAARIIRVEDGHDTLLVSAHSTGGLITALWAHRRRAARPVDALFLNSPFFDFNLPALVKSQAGVTVEWLGRRQPYGVLPTPVFPVYGHSLHVDFRGEWSYDLRWKPAGGFPIRYGWVAAIRAGQRRLHAGLSIDVPVLVACSTRSFRSRHWHEQARRCDAVLDVADIARWAPQLGRQVTVLRVNGGMHDLTLSAKPVREHLFNELARWTSAYVAAAPTATAAPPDGEAVASTRTAAASAEVAPTGKVALTAEAAVPAVVTAAGGPTPAPAAAPTGAPGAPADPG